MEALLRILRFTWCSKVQARALKKKPSSPPLPLHFSHHFLLAKMQPKSKFFLCFCGAHHLCLKAPSLHHPSRRWVIVFYIYCLVFLPRSQGAHQPIEGTYFTQDFCIFLHNLSLDGDCFYKAYSTDIYSPKNELFF